jgi:hypothetical protein
VISEQRERWLADGSPPVPTLVVAGVPHVLQHPAQAGRLLGLAAPAALDDAVRLAWDLDAIAQAALELASETPWEALLEPLPGLGRTPLALTVDLCHGIGALPAAFATGWFHWPGNPVTGETGDEAIVAYERSVVAGMRDREDLLAFVRPVAEDWRAFAVGERTREEPVRTPRGELTWAGLLEAQRLHAAQHYRQATAQVESLGVPVPALDLASLHELRLPRALY